MKLLVVFFKTMREFRRDLLVLILSVIFAPLFVLLYWMFTGGGSTTYPVLVVNQDQGAVLANGSRFEGGTEVMESIQRLSYANGQAMMKVEAVSSRAAGEPRLKDRNATLLLIIPQDLSRSLASARENGGQPTGPASTVTFVGDLTNPAYAVAGVMVNAALEQYVQSAAGLARPVKVSEDTLGASAARTEFENYVPGLLVFAVIMLIFLTAMTVAREVEGGTLRRLQIARLSAFDYLGGTSLAVILIGIVSVLITFAVAASLGFHSQGPLWVAILVGAFTCVAVVGAGLLVAAFSRTVSQAFVIANFPLALFMFFSGVVFPMKPIVLFSVAGRAISLFDFIPATHGVAALNKILVLGDGLGQVGFELAALLVLSGIYFALGVFFFQRRHLAPSR